MLPTELRTWREDTADDFASGTFRDSTVEAAGFVLDAESSLLANNDDPHSSKVFDPSIKGHTDRFAYRFVKA